MGSVDGLGLAWTLVVSTATTSSVAPGGAQLWDGETPFVALGAIATFLGVLVSVWTFAQNQRSQVRTRRAETM